MDERIKKGLWNEVASDLKQVTLESGRYYLDAGGNKWYSVSTILEKNKSDYERENLRKWKERVGPEEANRASNDGTEMHQHIEKYLINGYERQTGSGRGFRLYEEYENGFLKNSHIIPRLIESQLVYEVNGYRYAGTVDLIGDIQLPDDSSPILSVMDHKSTKDLSSVNKKLPGYSIQLSAYAKAAKEAYGQEITRGLIGFASVKGFKLCTLDAEQLALNWKLFYEKLQRFYEEGLYEQVC